MSVYEGHGVTLHHGDCLDVLRSLPDASVDSVVTDPPYGLEFMGKDWDAPWKQGADVHAEARTRRADEMVDESKRRFIASSVNKYAAGLPFQQWCEAWATECLRVLKPGGHLLAFGGTRTWHRLACAIEDAGFEVRDSIAWLYGSGFPKSLDVSKAIDKRPGVSQHPAFAAHLAERRQSAGLSRADVSEHVVGTRTGACWNWEHHQFPEAKWWPALRDLLDLDEAKWGPIIAEAERQKIGERTTGLGTGRGAVAYIGDSDNRDVTAPATDAAREWEGWGTALKPSFEGIVCATKPVPALARIGSRLDELEQSCRPPASGAVPSSAPTHPDSLGARTASAPASAATRREAAPARTTPTGAAGGSSAATATSASELTGATFWNTVTSWKACWAELCEATSTSTTGTTSSTTTDLETLWSCLSQITPESTTTDPTSPDGLSSLVGAVDAMFAAAVLNSRATRTLTAIGSATSGTPPTSPAAGGSRAAFEPVVVARKPLAGTVAGNVLTWGTGALNIDACRIEGEVPQVTQGLSSDPSSWEPRSERRLSNPHDGGRWPANVILDREMAEALDEQSGERPGFSTQRNAKESEPGSSWFGTRKGDTRAGEIREGYNDTGGASRFFFIAREDNPCHSTSSASTVESPSSHPRGPAASAPSDAATTACPDGERLTGSPSTSETPSASRPSVESGTTPTTSTVGASSPDWKPGEPSQMVSRARYAASLSRTATTTTTTSPSSSAGSVDPTTSSTTQASAPGVPLDELGSRFKYVAKADASERPRLPKRSLRLRDDLTPEQVDHVRARLVEAGVQVD